MNEAVMQLDFLGRETPHPAPTGAHLGPHEREVLRALAYGSLTSTQAGKICHEIRGWCGYRCPYGRWNERLQNGMWAKMQNPHLYNGSGCCPYAAAEGTEVMKRLRRRGFVEKHAGLWFATRTDWN